VTWQENIGRAPRTGEKQLRVRWREGSTSKWTYTAKQLNWSDRGDPLDVTHWKEEN
jgi:hypothetical protein